MADGSRMTAMSFSNEFRIPARVDDVVGGPDLDALRLLRGVDADVVGAQHQRKELRPERGNRTSAIFDTAMNTGVPHCSLFKVFQKVF